MLSEAKYKAKYGKQLKILSPKQMHQRLSISLAQIKASNTFENILNEIRQILYFYPEKEVTEKVCNNIINSIKFHKIEWILHL